MILEDDDTYISSKDFVEMSSAKVDCSKVLSSTPQESDIAEPLEVTMPKNLIPLIFGDSYLKMNSPTTAAPVFQLTSNFNSTPISQFDKFELNTSKFSHSVTDALTESPKYLLTSVCNQVKIKISSELFQVLISKMINRQNYINRALKRDAEKIEITYKQRKKAAF